jgi:hypothetical protein
MERDTSIHGFARHRRAARGLLAQLDDSPVARLFPRLVCGSSPGASLVLLSPGYGLPARRTHLNALGETTNT